MSMTDGSYSFLTYYYYRYLLNPKNLYYLALGLGSLYIKGKTAQAAAGEPS